jgi:hypothetical protein
MDEDLKQKWAMPEKKALQEIPQQNPIMPEENGTPHLTKSLTLSSPVSISTGKTPKKDSKRYAEDLTAQMIELVKSGMSPKAAAEAVGADFKAMDRKTFERLITDGISSYHLPPVVAKEAVRAARNQVLVEALLTKDHKTVLEATKQIATDPEVGLNAPPIQVTSLKVDSLKDLLEKVSEKDFEDLFAKEDEENGN